MSEKTEEYLRKNYWTAYNKVWTRAYEAGREETKIKFNLVISYISLTFSIITLLIITYK